MAMAMAMALAMAGGDQMNKINRLKQLVRRVEIIMTLPKTKGKFRKATDILFKISKINIEIYKNINKI